MNKLIDWTMKRANLREALTLIALSLVVLIAFSQIKPLTAMLIAGEPRPEAYPEMIDDMILVMIFIAPLTTLLEELVGRVLTTFIAMAIFGKHRSAVIPLLIGSSALFAFLHCLGPMSLMMAMWTYLPVGLILQLVYLKCGGWKGHGGVLTGLLCCWVVHLVYNWCSYASLVVYAQ